MIGARIFLVSLGRKGGGPAYGFEAAKALSKKHTVIALCSQYCEILPKWITLAQKGKIELLSIPTYRSVEEFIQKTSHIKRIWEDILPSFEACSPDIVYYPMGHPWDYYLDPEFQKHRIPIIHTIHETNTSSEPSLFSKLLVRKGIVSNVTYASGIIMLNARFKDDLTKKRKYPPERIQVIPHADFHDYTPPFIEEEASRKRTNILFFGRINKSKGIDILYRAFEIAAREDSELRLTVCGNGPLQKLKPTIDPMIEKRITVENRWIGEEEIPGIFSACDFLLLPFQTHSQSGVIAMARAFGKPVITSNIGGIPEQVTDGVSGLLCQPGLARDFAQKVLALAHTPALYRDLFRGMAEDRVRFSWDYSASLMESFFERILETKHQTI